VKTPRDDRAAWARAYGRASAVITIALGMVVPGVVGIWVDRRLETGVIGTFGGFTVGIAWGIWQLGRMASPGGGHRDDD
jgi:hypothetical protein